MKQVYPILTTYQPAVHQSGKRPLSDIRIIVLHDMEDTNYKAAAEDTGRWFENAASGGSSNFGIDDDSIQRYLPLDVIPWGAPGANTQGVHIEQMGAASWSEKEWNSKARGTLDRCAWLIAHLHHELGIPIQTLTDAQLKASHRGVTTHMQCTRVFGGTHTDPGYGYPLVMVLARARFYAKQM
jgi:hypothetical protein